MTAPDEAHRRAEGAQIRDIWTAERKPLLDRFIDWRWSKVAVWIGIPVVSWVIAVAVIYAAWVY